MKTVNTVIANIVRIIRITNDKEDPLVYQYWKVGRELSYANKMNAFGSDFMNTVCAGLIRKGIENRAYHRRGLYRMLQYYEAYPDWKMYSSCLIEINWSCHILLLDGIEQSNREFWLELCANRKYSVRKLKEDIKKWRTGILYRPGSAVDLIQVEALEDDETHVKCIINGHTYVVPTPDELERMRVAGIGTVNKDELVNIRNVEVKNVSSPLEYIICYLDQVKNPYCCMVDDCVVKSEFQEGVTWKDSMELVLRRI